MGYTIDRRDDRVPFIKDMTYVSSEIRRQQLIDAAFSVISTEGIQRATTRRIAEVASTSLATVHYCFSSKDELYIEVFKALARQIVDSTKVCSLANDLAERGKHYVIFAAEWALSDPKRAHAMYETTLWATRRDSGGVSVAKQVYEIHVSAIREALVSGENSFDEEVLRSAARLILSLVDGLMLQWISGANDAQFRNDSRLAGVLIHRFLRSMTEVEQI